MRNMTEKRAVELNWGEVCDIASAEIEEILGLQVPCRVDLTGTEFWTLVLEDHHLPLPKLCQLLQAMQATPSDWADALPDDGGTGVAAIGMIQAEKLIGRHLKLQWKHRLITAEGLWLVGVSDIQRPQLGPGNIHDTGCALARELVQAVADIADCLQRREGR